MASYWFAFIILLPCLYLEYKYNFFTPLTTVSRERKAMIGLDSAIGSNGTNYDRVAVGVNANLDLILSAIKLFNKLGITEGTTGVDHDTITSLKDLEECFSFYFKKCAAAERFVANKDVFDAIVNAAKIVENAQYDVGGNAAIMGLKLLYSNKNSTVMLGGPVGPHLQSLLDKRIIIPEIMKQESDEYHLILEYGVGEAWGGHTSSCANRFIISHDVSNGQMTSMEKFFASVATFNGELVVISGLHLLEGQPEEIRKQKIDDLKLFLHQIPPTTPIHLELASMASVELMTDIALNIFPHVDSIGLNEQELSFLSQVLEGPGDKAELEQWPPEIGLIADVLHWVLITFGRNLRYGAPSSRLTRIHFHCLTYHIIAVLPRTWENSNVAVAAGSRAASRQACDKEDLSADDVQLRTPEYFARSVQQWELRRNLLKHDEANPVTSWSRDHISFHFSAVLVCRQPKRTVGLGDCISATGLQYSKFLHTSSQ